MFGGVAAGTATAVVAIALAPLGSTPGPWLLLTPARLAGAAWLLVVMAGRVVASNVRLARRICWPRPRRALP